MEMTKNNTIGRKFYDCCEARGERVGGLSDVRNTQRFLSSKRDDRLFVLGLLMSTLPYP